MVKIRAQAQQSRQCQRVIPNVATTYTWPGARDILNVGATLPNAVRTVALQWVVIRKLQAVYEGGVLRPTEQLSLEEHRLVNIIVLDEDSDVDEIDFEPPHSYEALANHSVKRETVQAVLSKISGSLDADFAAERNER